MSVNDDDDMDFSVHEDNNVEEEAGDEKEEQQQDEDYGEEKVEEEEDDDKEEDERNKLGKKQSLTQRLSFEFYSKKLASLAISGESEMTKLNVKLIDSSGKPFSLKSKFPGEDDQSILTSLSKKVYSCMTSCSCILPGCFDEELNESTITFDNIWQCYWHVVVEHCQKEEDQQKWKCPFKSCNLLYDSFQRLVKHVCTELEYRRWKCLMCPTAFYKYDSLLHHIKSIHVEEKQEELVEKVYNNNEPTGELAESNFTPLHSPQKLKVSFLNVKESLVPESESILTKMLPTYQHRYLLFKTFQSQAFKQTCVLANCTALALAEQDGEKLCTACRNQVNVDRRVYKTETPIEPFNLTGDEPFYYVLQIKNNNDKWIYICLNPECSHPFGDPRFNSFCSKICQEHGANPEQAVAHDVPPPPEVTLNEQFPWQNEFDEEDDEDFGEDYDEEPDDGIIRFLEFIFTGEGWNKICISKGCNNKAKKGDLCDTCFTNYSLGQSIKLKRKPRQQSNFTLNTKNDPESGELVFTVNDTIWVKKVYSNENWFQICAIWSCGAHCGDAKNPICCQVHTKTWTKLQLPEYRSVGAIQKARHRLKKKIYSTTIC